MSDSIESIIIATCAVIVAACSLLTLMLKKYPVDPTKLIRGVVVLIAVAAVALVSGVISGSMTTLSFTIVAVCSILLLIKIRGQKGTPGKPPKLLVTAVFVMFAIGIMLLIQNKLPAILGKVVREEWDIIALEIEAAILKGIREGNEKVVATLADSQAVCKLVYREALERTCAGKCAYIDRSKGRYFFPENWKEDGKPALLTADEEGIIQDCVATHENKEDLCELIYLVLNDERMITELARPGAYDVEYYEVDRVQDDNTTIAVDEKAKVIGPVPVVTRKTQRHITPYEKIAIIGAYIDEKRALPNNE